MIVSIEFNYHTAPHCLPSSPFDAPTLSKTPLAMSFSPRLKNSTTVSNLGTRAKYSKYSRTALFVSAARTTSRNISRIDTNIVGSRDVLKNVGRADGGTV
jgi:hypothetical protein